MKGMDLESDLSLNSYPIMYQLCDFGQVLF